jgi:hypothetical protein
MAAPHFVVGSVQALTDAGELVTVSYTGAQLGPYAAAARGNHPGLGATPAGGGMALRKPLSAR